MNAKEKILDAADRLFGNSGFDATSTREIAELSGVNKALIHYHFQSKEGLLTELLDRYYQRLAETVKDTFVMESGLRERLLALVDTYMEFLEKNRNFGRIVQREAAGGNHIDRIAGHMVPLFEIGSQALKTAYPATKKGDLSAEQLLVSFYGAVISYFTYGDMLNRLLGDDPMSPGRFKERKRHMHRLAEILIDSVSGEPLDDL